MADIKFTHNWNGKLNPGVVFFSTIRAHKPGYYREGMPVNIWLRDKIIFTAEIKHLHTLRFGDIHPITIMIDTGYSYDESCKIFKNLLKCNSVDELKLQLVDHLLIEHKK